jgi:hypothetical protein
MEFSRADPFAAERAVIEEVADSVRLATEVPAVDTLAGLGASLLQVITASAAGLQVVLPSRQIVYMAPIPADCEQVAVLFNGWTPWPVQIGPTVRERPFRWMAGFSVAITRNSPAVPAKQGLKKAVSPDAMIAASRIASDDCEVLLGAVGRLSEVGPDLTVVAHAPQGAMQTVELNVQLFPTGSF